MDFGLVPWSSQRVLEESPRLLYTVLVPVGERSVPCTLSLTFHCICYALIPKSSLHYTFSFLFIFSHLKSLDIDTSHCACSFPSSFKTLNGTSTCHCRKRPSALVIFSLIELQCFLDKLCCFFPV